MNRPKARWSPRLDDFLREEYPHRQTSEIAWMLGLRTEQVYSRAQALGLRKTEACALAIQRQCGKQFAEAGKRNRFRKGHIPANKGLRRPGYAPGRMRETQFKPGRPAHEARNYKPIGSHHIVYGNVEVKLTDDPSIYPAGRWAPVHRLVWEAEHGPVPEGHVVVFKRGMHTTDPDAITTDRLELLTHAQLMRRNSVHRHGPEIAYLYRLKGALTRKIRNREEQSA